MGGCRCSYKNCDNTTKTTENIHFFHYPVKYKDRCKVWIENANKPQFCDLEEDQLRNKVVCELHFEDRWFANTQKKRLLQGAIPTLDAGSNEDPLPPLRTESPVYLSTQLQDVQVLPANDDGTIFVLDTDTMFSRSQKVESYIYKNGVIVPANKQKPAASTTKPSTSTYITPLHYSILNSGYELPNSSRGHEEEQTNVKTEETSEYKVLIKKETPEYNETIINKSITQQNISHRQAEDMKAEQMNYEDEEGQVYEMSYSNFPNKKVGGPRSGNTKNIMSKNIIEKSMGRNYLRKIKQHSRDIASIKRMLKQKALAESKPDITVALNSMKEQLPPTFFTILNLNLNSKCDLTDDDVDFFTTIHKTSPEVYQLLIDKYKWNLPCVDVVETPME